MENWCWGSHGAGSQLLLLTQPEIPWKRARTALLLLLERTFAPNAYKPGRSVPAQPLSEQPRLAAENPGGPDPQLAKGSLPQRPAPLLTTAEPARRSAVSGCVVVPRRLWIAQTVPADKVSQLLPPDWL